MKYKFLAVATLFLASLNAYADLKVGFVQVDKILQEAPQTIESNKKLEKEFDPNTKIIAVKMPSRFVRGINKKKVMEKEKVDQMNTTRRVYIQYTPYDPSNPDPQKRRKCDYINAWFCTCKNGRQLAGCCSHWLLNY